MTIRKKRLIFLKITWSEYAVTNHKEVWVPKGEVAPHVYQHVDSTDNDPDNAKYGYMLYCDGSQQPGIVFNLKVDADLCPGSTMYFSAYLCDASSTGDGKSPPNMDFVVTGIDVEGKEHALTTFTTGEFGINAVKKVGEGAKMERAKWYQIMFPVKFDAGVSYPSYRLQIFKFVSAEKVSEAQLDIVVEDTTAIKAGLPYLIKWAPASPEVIPMPLEFHNVFIEDNEGQTRGESDEVQFIGSVPRNTPARIIVRKPIPTGMESASQQPKANCLKLIIDGQVIIIRNGKTYDVTGKELQIF